MGTPLSGKNGDITISGTAISELKNWKMSRKSTNHAYSSNKTSGWKKRIAGVKDSTLTFQMLDVPANNSPALNPGDAITCVLKVAAATTYKTVPVIIDNIDADVDLDEGAIISYDVSCSGNGAEA